MAEKKQPKSFISYSHADKDVARTLANYLQGKGVDTFWDEWDIQPGDSIVEKIFEHGLKDCDIFIVLLSPTSVNSTWVRAELDAAMINRLKGVTRVVPLVFPDVEVPATLQALLHISLKPDRVEEAGGKIVTVAYDLQSKGKPELGLPPPGAISNLDIPGMTREASIVGDYLARESVEKNVDEIFIDGIELAKKTKLESDALNDACDELEEHGLVTLVRALGTSPFAFKYVRPTYSLVEFFSSYSQLGYNPQEDYKVVIAALAALDASELISSDDLAHKTKLTAPRLNRAIDYLEDRGFTKVGRALGTHPYMFTWCGPTAKTRRFARQKLT